MALLTDFLRGIYLGIITGVFPGLVAWVLAFIFRYFTGVTLPGFGVVVLGVALAGVQGGILGLLDPTVAASPTSLVALMIVMMITLYAHSKGDSMGANFPRRITLRGLRDRTLSSDVIEKIGKSGQVKVTATGQVTDIEGYPPLPESLRNEIQHGEWTFPADLPISELEKRLKERLVREYDLGDIDVTIDTNGRASISAAPPTAGLSRKIPPGKRAVSINALIPTGIAQGDEVTIKTPDGSVSGTVVSARSSSSGSKAGKEKPAQEEKGKTEGVNIGEKPSVPEPNPTPPSAPTATGGQGRVTVAVNRSEVTELLNTQPEQMIVLSRGKRKEYELISLLKRANKRIRKLTVRSGGALDGKTLGELSVREAYNVAVLAVRSEGEWRLAPRGDDSLSAGEELFVVGTRDALNTFQEVV